MKSHIDRVDEVNFVISGKIDKRVLDKKLLKLKEQAKARLKQESTLDAKAIANRLQEMEANELQREAQSHILQNFIDAALKKAHIRQEEILGQPNFTRYEIGNQHISLRIELATRPKIDTELAYLDLIPHYTLPQPDYSNIHTKLQHLAKKHAPFSPLAQPRPAKLGDLVIIDFQGFLHGRLLEGSSHQGYKLKLGSKRLMGDFEEQLVGMLPGQQKRIDVTFPATYHTKELAGKTTQFDVTLHEIYEQVPLEIDDALAQKVLQQEDATLDTLTHRLKDAIKEEEFLRLYHDTLKPKIIQGLLSRFDFPLPHNVIEQEIDAKVNALAQKMSKEERKRYQESKTAFKELRDSLRNEAKEQIKIALIVDALAKKEQIEVSKEEVEERLREQALALEKDPDELVEYYQRHNLTTSVKVAMTEERLFRKLLEQVNS